MTNNFENENNDDFIEPEIGASEGGSSRGGMAGNLAEAWRTRPFFKLIVLIVAVFAVGVAGINFFGGNNTAGNEVARLGKPPALKEAPGGAATPYMRQQTEMANNERSEQAIANGGSAIPTPIGQTMDVGSLGGTEKKDDPLKELRIETDLLKKQIQQQQVQQQQQQAQPRPPEQFDNSLAEAMQRQMQQLMESWTPKGIKNVVVIRAEDLKAEQEKAAQALATTTATAVSSAEAAAPKIVVSAGTVSYAQLLTEANSDVPGPILAQIVSGPLSGARAIGGFQVAMGYEKYLVLKFSLADKKGKDYQINAIALDPDTTLGGMATEVDERYFTRVVLPAAAGFLQGMGQALGQSNTSVTTNGTTSLSSVAGNGYKQGIYNGLGSAAATMGQFFQNEANLTKPLVRVAAGTPLGIFFVTPVMEPSASNGGTQQNNANGGNGPTGNANYPGTTVNGYGANLPGGGVPYPNYATPNSSRNGMPGTSPFGSPSYGNASYGNAYGSMQASPYSQNYGQ